MKLQVAFLPRDLASAEGRVCILLDVLRASSTLVTLLAHGAEPVYVAGTVEAGRALAGRLPGRPLLCGEVGGLPPPDFDHGNSPTELAALALRGRPAVLATSNGTRALAALSAAPAVLVGCFLNASAAAARGLAVAQELGADLALVCAGDSGGTEFSLEDALAAGYLVAQLQAVGDGESHSPVLDDAALAAWRLFRSYGGDRAPAEVAAQGFEESLHGRELAALGFDADLVYCAQVDATGVVPELGRAGEALVLRHRGRA